MTRGDIAVVETRGTYTGKPRPAVIVQADLFNQTHGSVTLCPITSDCFDAPLFRVALPPGDRTGLRTASQVMVDKIVSVPCGSVGKAVGRCSIDELEAIEHALRRWLDL